MPSFVVRIQLALAGPHYGTVDHIADDEIVHGSDLVVAMGVARM